MSQDWSELIPFYNDFLNYKGWDSIKVLIQFVSDLIGSRNLDDLYYHTSHHRLCITLDEEYEIWRDKPILTIDAISDSIISIEIAVEVREAPDIYRAYIEKVHVPVEDSLHYFDEMIEKYKKKCVEQ